MNEFDVADMENKGLKEDKPFYLYLWLEALGWQREQDAVQVYVGPRGIYGAIEVMGQGQTLMSAIENAIERGNATWF